MLVLMSDVTQILSRIEHGDSAAAEQLLPLVYDELRKLASGKMSHEDPAHTLQPTGLVHEAYLRLVDVEQAQYWDSRGHFFAAAAEAMRRILVDHARRKKAAKHGGGRAQLYLSDVDLTIADGSAEVLELNDALEKLAEKHERKAELVKLRFFAGLTNEQAAEVLGISEATAYSDWSYARAWLRLETLGEGQIADR